MVKKGSSEPLKELADKLRSKGGVEWRTAIMAEQRVEYIRGKDFATYFREHDSEMFTWVSRGLKQEDQIKTLGELMIRRRLFVKADRMFKKPKPGKKRLAKWPKKLLPIYADQTFSEDFFYAWQYERPSSPWLFLLSMLLVAVVLLFCLFPLAPHPIKLAVVYLSMTLLVLIFTIIGVRTLLASFSWMALGRPLWLFPYLLSDDKGLDEAFWPIFQMEEALKDQNALLHGALRLAFGLGIALLSYAFYSHAPDKGAALGGAKHAHDAILEMLNLHERGRQQIGAGGSQNATAPPAELPAKGGPGSYEQEVGGVHSEGPGADQREL